MTLKEHRSKPSQPDNAEKMIKCPTCGNMFAVIDGPKECEMCHQPVSRDAEVLYASNEDY